MRALYVVPIFVVFIFAVVFSVAGCGPTLTKVVSGSYVHPLPAEYTEPEQFGCATLEVDIENLSATLRPIGHEPLVLELEPIDEGEWEQGCHAKIGSRILEAYTVVSPSPLVIGDLVLRSARLVAGCHLDSVGLEGIVEDSESGEERQAEVMFQDPASATEFC